MRIFLDPLQRRIIDALRGDGPERPRVIDLKASRRRGKTMIWRAAESLFGCKMIGKRIAYATPFAAQSVLEYRWLTNHRVLSKLGHGRTQPYPTFTFYATNTCVDFRTLENAEGMRGGEYDLIFGDESQSLRMLFSDFVGIISPMLRDRRGKLVLAGQFNGRNEYYQRFFLPGLKPDSPLRREGDPPYDPNYLSIVSDWRECMCFKGPDGLKELEIARKEVPESVWKQEYECIVSDSTCAVFKDVERVVGGLCGNENWEPHYAPLNGERYFQFWDLGKEEDPPATLVLAGRTGRVCLAKAMPLGTSYVDQARYVGAIKRHFNTVCAMDTTGAGTRDAILDLVRPYVPGLRGMHINWSKKQNMVRQAELELEQKRVQVPAQFKDLIHQLRRYEYEKNPLKGYYEYHAPREAGEHDDLVACLVGTFVMRNEGWTDASGGIALGATIG